MKTKTNSFLSILICLALILVMLPSINMTVHAEEDVLWIAGQKVTDSNTFDEGWMYDAKTKTLTLNNFSYYGQSYIWSSNNVYVSATIYCNHDLTICLEGDNQVKNTNSSKASLRHGIYCTNLTIKGDGTLDVYGSTSGINAGITLTVESGNVKSSGDEGIEASNFVMNGGYVDCSAIATACETSKLFMNGGKLIANSEQKTTGIRSYLNATVTGGYIETTKMGTAYALTITGGSIDVNAKYSGLEVGGELSIQGGSITVSSTEKAISGKFKNSISGTGWTDSEGTEGKTFIPVSDELRTVNYKKIQFPAVPAASLAEDPKANTLTANGAAQTLVTAGKANGGTIQYALGSDSTNAPLESAYSTTIPTGTNVGTYYVWYKVIGDNNHFDFGPVCIKVSIGEAAAPSNDISENNGSQEQQVLTPSSVTPDTVQAKPSEKIDKKQKSTTLSKLKAGKNSITVTWKKQSAKGIKGYELQYSTDKNFKKDVKTVTINKVKTTSKTIKKLKSGKKYFVKIRTFKKSGSEKTYSKWSKVKNIKLK